MFRKFFTTVAIVALLAGDLFAKEIKGVFKKFEDNKLIVAVDGVDMTYKVDPDAKIKRGDKEFPLSKLLSAWKDGVPITLTVDNDKVTDARAELRPK